MKRTWSSSQRLSKAITTSVLSIALVASSVISANASRNGSVEPTNTFTVGINFKFGEVEQLCSGAALTSTLIATAGHCAFSPTGETGTAYYFTSPGTPLDAAIDPRIVQPKVIKVYSDPQFSVADTNHVNDIVFLQLDKPITVKRYLKFATRSELNLLTAPSAIAGYGYGRVFESGAGYSIYPRRYPMQWKAIDSTTVLANTFDLTSTSSAPCKGDSGGPIVATLPSGKNVLVGVLSGANNVQGGCGSPSTDGLFYIRLTTGYNFLPLIASIYNPATAPETPVVAKKVTIKCKKGSVIKKVTAVKPVCPKGYKLTK